MLITSFSIKRPIAIAMAVLAVLIFGLISFQRTGLDLLPNMELPVTAVITVYPNADPKTIESSVTRPIEGSLRMVSNVKNITSISQENISIIIAEFNWGTDLGTAIDDISANLALIGSSLPSGSQKPIIMKMDPTQIPIISIGITGDENIAALTQRVRQYIIPRLEQIPGVARVFLTGGRDRVIEVEYSSEKLRTNAMSEMQLQQVLAYQNIEIPAGSIIDNGIRYSVLSGNRLKTIEDIGNLVVGIKSNRNASPASPQIGFIIPQYLRLKDIAEVKETFLDVEGFSRVNGEDSLVLSIQKQSDHNTVIVSRSIKKVIGELPGEFPDLEYFIITDQSDFIVESLKNLAINGLIGALLATIIILLFLKNVRSTLVISISIPLSIILTFTLIYFRKLTLNMMTMGGLALGIGMLVDNSIVVLENIHRHMTYGKEPVKASEEGTSEVAMAITASTLTTIVVFLPIVFVGNLAGELFKELALTVSFSLFASILVALTVVPLLSSRLFLKEAGTSSMSEDNSGSRRDYIRDPHFMKSLRDLYERGLRWALGHKRLMLAVTLVLVLLSLFQFFYLDKEFLPPVDFGFLNVWIAAEPGSPVNVVEGITKRAEAIISQYPEVEAIWAQGGESGGTGVEAAFTGSGTNTAEITLRLKPKDVRSKSTNELASLLRSDFEREFSDAEDLTIAVTETLGGSEESAFSMLGSQKITFDIKGAEIETLQSLAGRLIEAMKRDKAFINPESSIVESQPTILYKVDTAKSILAGLTAGQVGLSLRNTLSGVEVTTISREGLDIPVILIPRREESNTREDLENTRIFSSMFQASEGSAGENGILANLMGQGAILGKISTPVIEPQPMAIRRVNGYTTIGISASLDGITIEEAQRRVERMIGEIGLPSGYSFSPTGVSDLMDESFDQLKLAGALAVILVYMVMAVQFESLVYPLIIMFTLPLAAIGAIFLLFITRTGISITSIIGLVMLAGIVVNNAILMVDYINRLKSGGMPTEDALIEAGRSRLKPILMTALTTILGLLPLALKTGESSELEVPLAVTVIGGMVTATFLTLFIIPVIFEITDRLVNKKGIRRNGIIPREVGES